MTDFQTQAPDRESVQTFPLRQFVLYQAVVSGQPLSSPEATVRDYARAHPDADLDEELTFADWLRRQAESAPA